MVNIKSFIAVVIFSLCSINANAQNATPEDAVALVQRTIALIKQDGIEAVVKAVNNKDRRFKDRDLYVFIHDLRVPGKLIGHGTNVKLTEENNISYQDENGKYFVREMVDVAKSPGQGWVNYRIANANKTAFADKTAYIERIDDYFVGVGAYKAEAPNENTVGVISGNPYSAPTYLQIAYDMASVLNDGSNLRVVPVVGMGGSQNIRDVRSLKGIDIGFTQSNILNSYRRINERFKNAADENKIVYIANLFNEEVHLIARKDITSLSQLRGQKVNIDLAGSGTAFTMRDIFKNLGIQIEEVNVDQADAIEQMKAGEIAATILVAGKPAPVLQTIPREYNFHILPIPYANALQEDYLPASIGKEDYPALMSDSASVDTVAVSAVLIAYNWPSQTDRYRRVKKYVEALFRKIDEFKQPSRHPKWQSVNLASTLPGWDRFDVATNLVSEMSARSVATNQTSFEKFLTTQGLLSSSSPEDRTKLYEDFLEWAENQR